LFACALSCGVAGANYTGFTDWDCRGSALLAVKVPHIWNGKFDKSIIDSFLTFYGEGKPWRVSVMLCGTRRTKLDAELSSCASILTSATSD